MLKLYIYIKKQTNKSSIFWFFILVQTVWPKQYMKKQHQQNLVSHRAPCEYTATEAKLVDTNTYCTPTGSCVWTFSHVSQWAPYDYTKKTGWLVGTPTYFLFRFWSILSSVILWWNILMCLPTYPSGIIHTPFDQFGVGHSPFWNQRKGTNPGYRACQIRWKIYVLADIFVSNQCFDQWEVGWVLPPLTINKRAGPYDWELEYAV